MRTSRVSRDTSRILAVTRAQRTLRQNRSAFHTTVGDAHVDAYEEGGFFKEEETDASGSQFASALADSGPDVEASLSNKKRKRGHALPAVVKHEEEEISISNITSPEKAGKPRKGRRMPAKKITGPDGAVKIEPPANWEEMYTLTREMRNENIAPVDTMGCESLADKQRTPKDQRFQTLIALMLSSQTKDTVTAVAIRGMQENMPGVCDDLDEPMEQI